ncbi:MAG: aldo/keto reductase [Bowdeniella nasicola]|nr:aldo/keto reductase [Bowdeniella nasicola]
MTASAHRTDPHPPLGFGTYALADPARSVAAALGVGYRVIDTAASYDNEVEVGAGIRSSAVPREQVLLTSKLRGRDQGASTRQGLTSSLRDLGTDYVDLYLIHWPLPNLGRYLESYEAMMRAREEGLIRQLGVSNFLPEHLERIHAEFGEWPAVNQIEMHPYFPQLQALPYHRERGIEVQAWSPLARARDLLEDPVITRIARRVGGTAGQVVLAWHLALGSFPIPKTDSAARAADNLAAATMRLDDSDVAALSDLARGRIGGDPATHVEM